MAVAGRLLGAGPLMGERGQGHSQPPGRGGPAPRPTHGASAAGSGGAERRRFDRSTKDYPAMRQTHTCSAAVGASAMSDVHHDNHTSPVADAAYHRVGGAAAAKSVIQVKGPFSF